MMEEESCFLSKEDDNKIKLKKIFETVINDLNEKKVTTIVGKQAYYCSKFYYICQANF